MNTATHTPTPWTLARDGTLDYVSGDYRAIYTHTHRSGYAHYKTIHVPSGELVGVGGLCSDPLRFTSRAALAKAGAA